MEHVQKDERFAHIAKDPRFRRIKRSDRKVKIDKRFGKMFSDKQFKLKYRVDMRGRPVNRTTNENLRKFYDLSESDEGESSDDEGEETQQESVKKKKDIKTDEKQTKKKKKEKGKKKDRKNIKERSESTALLGQNDTSDDEIDLNGSCNVVKKENTSTADETIVSESEEKDTPDHVSSDDAESVDDMSESDSENEPRGIGGGIDLARGEGNVLSSDDDMDFELEDDEFDHNWGELANEAPEAQEITNRLAVCNMDWDRIKARDILILLTSFAPTGGIIKSVTVYPSEFGLKRMQEEDMKGPIELVNKADQQSKTLRTKEDSIEGNHYNREKLRQYQLNRLKYYYAVVECDSTETASKIYDECDGIEYESSATRMDLRFIPEDMEFDQKPHSVASDMPDISNYQPSQFINSALQQCKVNLTWDETDPDRIKLTTKNFKKEDIDAMNLNDYLASSSSEEEGDPYGSFIEQPFASASDEDSDEKSTSKYKNLLSSISTESHKDEDGCEMEISWQPGLKESTEKLVKKASKGVQSPWENFLEKKKEKKKGRRGMKEIEDDVPTEGVDTFSDDDLPDDSDEEIEVKKPAKKKKRRQREEETLTAEEEAEKKQKEAELSLLLMDEDDDKQHFSLQSIQEAESLNKKKKKKKLREMKKKKAEGEKQDLQDDFTMDVQDPRFQDVFDNPLYNIDPSATEYKKTKAMEDLIQEKLKHSEKKGKQREHSLMEKIKDESKSNDLGHVNLSGLIKSVKAKTQTLQNKKKHKKK